MGVKSVCCRAAKSINREAEVLLHAAHRQTPTDSRSVKAWVGASMNIQRRLVYFGLSNIGAVSTGGYHEGQLQMLQMLNTWLCTLMEAVSVSWSHPWPNSYQKYQREDMIIDQRSALRIHTIEHVRWTGPTTDAHLCSLGRDDEKKLRYLYPSMCPQCQYVGTWLYAASCERYE